MRYIPTTDPSARLLNDRINVVSMVVSDQRPKVIRAAQSKVTTGGNSCVARLSLLMVSSSYPGHTTGRTLCRRRIHAHESRI